MLSNRTLALLLACAAASGQTFSAGAGKAEITPPPGWPTGGHGPAGSIARGYWNPLYARAFYIGDGKTQGVILVSCDFFAVPLGLRAEVWKRVRSDAAALGVGPEGLILAATHTHQGPGNYLTAQVYNEFGSNESGFSEPLFDFLARRIGDAIEDALAHRKDARLLLHSNVVTKEYKDQFLLNRSPATFLLNFDRRQVLDRLNRDRPWADETGPKNDQCKALRMDGEPEDGWDLPGCPRLRAVDRRMRILELIDAADPAGKRRIGALIFFAVHPTDLIHTAPIYNSDFVGQAVDRMEADWSATVAFFNGPEGDITARRQRRDILEVRKRSMQFREAVDGVIGTDGERLDAGVQVRARLLDTQHDGDRTCSSATLAAQPSFGAAGVGGAEGDRTSLYTLGWKEGVRRSPQDNQGPKVPALDSVILPAIQLTGTLAPVSHFPRFLPVTYASIGGFELGAIPVEMSTTAAMRIRDEIGEKLQIIGLANEYASYTATASEYAAQDYMGASTLWGPQEAAYLGCQLAHLKNTTQPGPPFEIPGAVKSPGPPPLKAGVIWLLLSLLHIWKAEPFGPAWVGDMQDLPDDGLEEFLLNEQGIPERHLPFFEWTETVKDCAAEFDAHRTVEVVRTDGTRLDGEASSFLKILRVGADCNTTKTRLWSAIWLRPLWDEPAGEFQFRVTGGTPSVSQKFSVKLKSSEKPCSVDGCRAAAVAGPRPPHVRVKRKKVTRAQ